MAEKSGKKTKKKAAKADTGVLGNLSATRPTRIGGDRRSATTRRSSRPAAASAAKTAAAAPAAGKTAAARTTPAAATKPKPATKASKPKVRTNAGTQPKPPAAPPKGWQTPDQDGDQGGTGIVTTAVQAAGEIAQLGVTVGGQILKRAAGRIPRP
jgi:glucan-binding YG repeat protein